jgi:hypothetical protein
MITYFIDGFTLKMKSQIIGYLQSGSEHMVLDLEDEVHSIWFIWTTGLQECKGIFPSKLGAADNNSQSRS